MRLTEKKEIHSNEKNKYNEMQNVKVVKNNNHNIENGLESEKNHQLFHHIETKIFYVINMF